MRSAASAGRPTRSSLPPCLRRLASTVSRARRRVRRSRPTRSTSSCSGTTTHQPPRTPGQAEVAVTIELERPPLPPDAFTRADLEFRGVDHSGPSFEAWVFLNNDRAGPDTAPDTAGGYAG